MITVLLNGGSMKNAINSGLMYLLGYVFISLYSPIIFFSILGLGNENIISVARYMFKYLIRQKVYLYNKI